MYVSFIPIVSVQIMFLSHVANKSKHHSDINALIAKFGSSPPTINFNADYAERDYMYTCMYETSHVR